MGCWKQAVGSVVLTGLCAAMAAPARAQDRGPVQFAGPEPATVVLGGSATLRVVLHSTQGDRPRVEQPTAVPGLRFEWRGPSTQTRMVVGARGRTVESTVEWSLELWPQREGTFEFGPVRVFDGAEWHKSPVLEVTAVKEMAGEGAGFVSITQLPERVYAGETFDLEFQLGVRQDLTLAQGRGYFEVHLQADWLEGQDGLEVLRPQGDGTVPIVINREVVKVPQDGAVRDGTNFYRFWVRRRLVATAPGKLELAGPVLAFSVATGAQRGRFNERVPGGRETLYAYGEAQTIDVRPLPTEGRPVDFSGAIGQFELSARVDRARLAVGDSLKATVVVEGAGNLEQVDLPARLDFGGFHDLGRTDPVRAEDRVAVTYDLRVLDTVAELPPIPFSWFDTGREAYVTEATAPVPLAVAAGSAGEALTAPAEPIGDEVESGTADIADIRLPEGPPPRARRPGAVWVWLACLGPWLLGAAAWGGRRWRANRQRDVAGRRARSAARTFEAKVAAGGSAGEALVEYLAARLGVAPAAVVTPDLEARLAAAGVGPDEAREAQELLAAEGAARYGAAGAGADPAVARQLVARLERAPWSPPLPVRGAKAIGAAALWLGLGAVLAAAAPAQDDGGAAADPVAAYRAGDYDAAVRGFAAECRRDPDNGRAWFNLGNAHYRRGDYARALWAYEGARRITPRDRELLLNLQLTRSRLGLGDGIESFGEAVRALRLSTTKWERVGLTAGLQLLAVGLLVFGWGRPLCRVLGGLLLLPAAVLVLEIVWWGPARPMQAVALTPVGVYAEPNPQLEPIARLRPGSAVGRSGRGASGTWCRIWVDGRRGYVRRDAIAGIGVPPPE